MSHRGIIVLVLTLLLLAGAIAPAFAQQVPNALNTGSRGPRPFDW